MLRPRFTLRVVLVVMTIVAVVAWQGSFVLKRKQCLRVVRTFTLAEMERTNQNWTDGNHRPEYAPNFLRRLFGDEDFAMIQLQPRCTDEELEGTAALFPEAAVQRSMFSW